MLAIRRRVCNHVAFLLLLPLLRVSYWDLLKDRFWTPLRRPDRWINIETFADRKFYIDIIRIKCNLFMSFAVTFTLSWTAHDKKIVIFLFICDWMC